VEVIGTEVISAGHASSDNSTVLVHCRVNPGGQLIFTVKAHNQTHLQDLQSKHVPKLAV